MSKRTKRRKFAKPSLTIGGQIEKLVNQGLIIPDLSEAENWFSEIGSFRLRGYFFPFLVNLGGGEKVFRKNTKFEKVLEQYFFDSDLRTITFEKLGRIEIFFKRIISDTLSNKYNPHWFYQPEVYRHPDDIRYFIEIAESATKVAKENVENTKNKSRDAQPQSVDEAYFTNYHSPKLPPSWIIFELLTFGKLSHIIARLNNVNKKLISESLKNCSDIKFTPRKLKTWLRSFANLRNFCAHHNRIWNKKFPYSPPIPEADFNINKEQMLKFYGYALAIRIIEKNFLMEQTWKSQLEDLFSKHQSIDISLLGFPKDWKDDPIWDTRDTTP